MDELLLFTVTSPSLHFKQTGSFLQFLLTSSPLNTDGRAPTIHSDEPFTTLQTDELPPIIRIDEPFIAYQSDGLLLTILIDELSPQNTWTSSYNSLHDELFLIALPDELLLFTWASSHNSLPDKLFLTALPDELLLFTWTSSYNSLPDELLRTTLPDNLSPLTHGVKFYSTTHTNEQSPIVPKDELYSPPTIDDLSHKQGAQLKNHINTCKSVDEGHRPNPMSSTYSNHSVWEPGQFK